MATLSDIRTRTSELMGDTGFTVNSSAFYDQSINDAQREIVENISMLFTTSTISSVSGTQSYDLPTDFVRMYSDNNSVKYTDTDSTDTFPDYYAYDAARLSYKDLNDTTVTGTPTLFYLNGDSIYFYKTPDFSGSSNITIEHYKYPATLSNNSDTTDISDKYKLAVVYLTAAKISDRNELWDQGQMFRLRYYYPELNRVDNTNDELRTSKRTTGSEYLGDTRVGVIGAGTK